MTAHPRADPYPLSSLPPLGDGEWAAPAVPAAKRSCTGVDIIAREQGAIRFCPPRQNSRVERHRDKIHVSEQKWNLC